MASTNISRTLSSGAASNKFTFSCWVKRSVDTAGRMFSVTGSSGDTYFRFNGDATIEWSGDASNASSAGFFTTNRRFDDYNAWYHFVIRFDSTQGSASDRVRFYVNGVQEESFASYTDVNQNAVDKINLSGNTFYIGGTVSSQYFHGLMSHVNYSDGYSYAPTEFGETDSTTGEWKIKTNPSINYGTNGFFVLKDGATLTDSSANSNNFAVANGTLTPTEDCPSNVFATLNPLQTNLTLTNGNTAATTTNYKYAVSTIGINSGKYYFEMKVTHGCMIIGIQDFNKANERLFGSGTFWFSGSQSYHLDGFSRFSHDSYGDIANDASAYPTYGNGDIIMMAVNLDDNKMAYGKNGTWYNSTNPGSGTTNMVSIDAPSTLDSGFYGIVAADTCGASDGTFYVNFGNGYFGTTAISSEGSNTLGHGKFEYDVPAGYTALCTKGLNE